MVKNAPMHPCVSVSPILRTGRDVASAVVSQRPFPRRVVVPQDYAVLVSHCVVCAAPKKSEGWE